MAANIQNLTNSNFQPTLDAAKTPVLVDFWAPWCGPCKLIAPVLEELATEMAGQAQVCKVDIDDNNDIAVQYGIRSIPTLMVFKAGKAVDQIVGTASKDTLKQLVSRHLN